MSEGGRASTAAARPRGGSERAEVALQLTAAMRARR